MEISMLFNWVGLDNTSDGTDIFPMSWMELAIRIPSIVSLGSLFFGDGQGQIGDSLLMYGRVGISNF